MRGKKIIRRVLILASIILVLYVIYVIKNITLYKLEAEIKDEFDNVDCLEVWDSGPHCTVVVFVDKDSDFEDIEPVFISMMLKLHEDDNFNYLRERHSRNATGELAFLQVSFYEEGTDDNRMFEFISYKYEDFQLWKLGGEASVPYTVSDYKK